MKRFLKANGSDETLQGGTKARQSQTIPEGGGQATPAAKITQNGQKDSPGRMRQRLLPESDEWVLTRICKIMISKLESSQLQRLIDNMTRNGKRVTLLSMCSGSEVAYVSMLVIQTVLGVGNVKLVSSCDNDPRKQRFIASVIGPLPGGDGCIFADISKLGGMYSQCVVHENNRCRVKSALIGSCGFSCKNYSRLHATSSTYSAADVADGVGSSGETLGGLLNNMESHPCPVCHLENVEAIVAGKPEHIEYLGTALLQRGYVLTYDVVCSTSWGVPHKRNRWYGVAMHMPLLKLSQEQCEDAGKKIFRLMRKMKSSPMPLEAFLLSGEKGDEYLKKELSRRLKGQMGPGLTDGWKKCTVMRWWPSRRPSAKSTPRPM